MWIHRIHADAQASRGYSEISPGLALGLCFIPSFQYPWTGWTLMRLSAHCMQSRPPDAPATREEAAVRTSKLCFIASFAVVAAGLVMTYVMLQSFFSGAALARSAPNPANPFAAMQMQQSPAMRACTIVVNAVGLLAFITYA